MAALSENIIKSLHWVGKDKRILDGQGLYLNLRRNSKTWLFRKKHSGKTQIITLGKWPTLSCKQARLDARRYADESNISNKTVSDLIAEYKKDVVYPDSKVPKQVEGYLNHIDQSFGQFKVMGVKRAQLVYFIKQYSVERGARSADRVRSYLKQVFAYGVELGYLTGSSPMDGVTKRVTGYKPIDRSRVLSNDEIRIVWSWKNPDKGQQNVEDNARVIKFLLLTGLRISEAQAGYIDGDKFRIDDTKGKHSRHESRPHWVHLPEQARALLPLPECSATNIQAWLKRLLIAEGIEPRFTPHDCRRTFATLANDNGAQPFIVERVLNHKMQGVMAVYNYAEYEDERIECAEIVDAAIREITENAA
jgi:integrase